MDATVTVLITATLFVWGLVSKRLERAELTGPIVFVLVGASLAWAGLAQGPTRPEHLTPLVEIALVWVLFSDAARLPLRQMRRDLSRYVRLLAIGLPLTLLLGWVVAAWFFPHIGIWLALFVGAALAPTDAALGVQVVTDPEVPARIRQLITVESGLNDGIVTPVVMLAIAGAATAAGIEHAASPRHPLAQLLVGAVIGSLVGAAGGWSLRWGRRHGIADEDFAGIAVVALTVLTYAAAVALGSNGFVAAFCGGLAFGACAGRRAPAELLFLEQMGTLVSLLVWLAFGAIAVPVMVQRIDVTTVVYAIASLTVLRMLPVALALTGAGLSWRTILFVGWFGPRGLASLVFALLALEALGSGADEAIAIVAATILLSVALHGASAAPLAQRFGKAAATAGSDPEIPHLDVAPADTRAHRPPGRWWRAGWLR